MWGKPFPVAGALDNHPVIGVGQPVESAVAQYGTLEQPQPFVHRPVAGGHEAGCPEPVLDELVQFGRLLGGEPVQAQVVQISRPGERKERKLRSKELSILAWAKVLK